jgi:dolichol-phosphate mannosyltransferase
MSAVPLLEPHDPLEDLLHDPRRAAGTTAARPPVLVVIPTYDEATTIERVLRRVRTSLPDADVLVVDDASPDGTARIVESVGADLGNIMILHRTAKDGLGAAYRAGFAFGLAQDYRVLVEMDADLQHDPAALPALVAAVEAGADLAIGSRYVPGASIPDWAASRRALSRWGNRYAASVLGVPLHDLTSGYRAYRAGVLRSTHVESSTATGYGFQIELAYRVARAGGRIVELPICFGARSDGASKMSGRIAVEALVRVTGWAVRDRLHARSARPVLRGA